MRRISTSINSRCLFLCLYRLCARSRGRHLGMLMLTRISMRGRCIWSRMEGHMVRMSVMPAVGADHPGLHMREKARDEVRAWGGIGVDV